MGIIIGKACMKLVRNLIIVGGILYVEYRVAGGPPIRKVYKAVKQERIDKKFREAQKNDNIVYIKDYQVV